MVESILRINHVVKAYECNWKGELSLSHVVGIMMLASRKQERSLAHPDLIYQKGLSWIVIQNQLTVNRLPKLEEEIIIETEPIGYNKFFTFRRYTILSLDEEVLVDALTTFSMINIEERKLISLDEEVLSEYPIENKKDTRRNPRVPKIDLDNANVQTYRVRLNDIDYNQHVNNAKYFDWVMDSLGMEFVGSHRLKSVLVKYEKEILPEASVKSFYEIRQTENGVQTLHQLVSDEQKCCHLSLEWEMK